MADARLPDGARVNAIIPPLAIDGPVLSIRRFGGSPLRVKDMVAINSATPGDAGVPGGLREGEAQLPDLGRYRHRQDDDAQRAVVVHPRERARRHHRGRRRAAAAAAARRAPGDAPAQHRGQGRGDRARSGQERAAYASRPHRHRRVPRRRGARHAAGDEHRPRGLDDHGARQHAARRAVARRGDGRHGRHPDVGGADPPDDRPLAQRDHPARRAAPTASAASPASPRSPTSRRA